MSLLDALRPKWQNSNPEKRLEAVEDMDVREQSTLERIALSDEDSSVRTAAVKKLTLIPSLSAISCVSMGLMPTEPKLPPLKFSAFIRMNIRNYPLSPRRTGAQGIC